MLRITTARDFWWDNNCYILNIKNCASFYIVNLYSYRATDPDKLKEFLHKHKPFEDKKNDDVILELSNKADTIVLAWGNEHKKRSKEVLKLLEGKTFYFSSSKQN